eukprot:TRINITY_DN37481_c0_g1_i1.p1 TRINITY_DN37481_c0_g1~~TRINITY_DN37481_c0_g1_i1.p1  ORF type:complete len:123 (-),score=29.97 TRINITY_DN37481_c0_g1_i1:140-484(-)
MDTTKHGCKDNCVYEKKDNLGSKYCFAVGELEVHCGGDGASGSNERQLFCEEEELRNFGNLTGQVMGHCCHMDGQGTTSETMCTTTGCSNHCADVGCVKKFWTMMMDPWKTLSY